MRCWEHYISPYYAFTLDQKAWKVSFYLSLNLYSFLLSLYMNYTKIMMNFEQWFTEYETLVLNLQPEEDPNLNPDNFHGFYTQGLSPYETYEIEYPSEYEPRI